MIGGCGRTLLMAYAPQGVEEAKKKKKKEGKY